MAPNWKPGERTWRDLAACRSVNTAVFFPKSELSGHRARLICSTCPVREQCLAWAIATGQPDGIWGGKSTHERNRIARSVKRAVRAA